LVAVTVIVSELVFKNVPALPGSLTEVDQVKLSLRLNSNRASLTTAPVPGEPPPPPPPNCSVPEEFVVPPE
jgi:hypothetical protein